MRRIGSLLAVLTVAVAGGALAAVLAATFLWVLEGATEILWTDLPHRFGVDAFGSWWMFGVLVLGALLVGLGRRLLGRDPEPLEAVIETWRTGGRIEPGSIPAAMGNSIASLAFGGPVGFEAALTAVVGGAATGVGRWIAVVGRHFRSSWGAPRVDALPHWVRTLPHWLAGVSGLVTYRNLSFGRLATDFRLPRGIGVEHLAAVFVFSAAVCVPAIGAVRLIRRTESVGLDRVPPFAVTVVSAVTFGVMALGSRFVLFSGQDGFLELRTLGRGVLVYLMVAKVAALMLAFLSGWRGGPIFPTFFAVAALGVLVADLLDMPPEFLMVAAVVAVSLVFLRGKVLAALLLSLYVVPISAGAISLVAVVGAATSFALMRRVGVAGPEESGPDRRRFRPDATPGFRD